MRVGSYRRRWCPISSANAIVHHTANSRQCYSEGKASLRTPLPRQLFLLWWSFARVYNAPVFAESNKVERFTLDVPHGFPRLKSFWHFGIVPLANFFPAITQTHREHSSR